MAVTRIKNNQITDASSGNAIVGINAAAKLQDYSITAGKIANSLVYGSDFTVSGNLTVNGTTTTVDTVNTLIQDPILVLADGQTSGAPSVDIGILGYRGNQNSSFIGWVESQDEFVVALSNTTISNTTANITAYANLRSLNLLVNQTITATGNIVGGNIQTGGQVSVAGNIIANNATITTFANIGTGSGNVLQVNGRSVFNGNTQINGNLSVLGNITYINVSDLTINDPLIFLAANNTSDVEDIGFVGQWNNGTQQYGGFARDYTDDTWKVFGNVVAHPTTTVDWANAVYQPLWSGSFKAWGNISATGTLISAGQANISNSLGVLNNFSVGPNGIFFVNSSTNTASFGTTTQTTNALVSFNTTTSILTPVGNTAQRPSVGVTGMMRFNTNTNSLEVYDNSQWASVGVPVFTVIADEQFNGDGTTVSFTLGSTQTTNSCIVSINGVVQVPSVAYSVSGTDPTCVLTFTEAPAAGDLIDVREITTTTSVTTLVNTSGNAIVEVTDAANTVIITGDLIPIGNNAQSLGKATNVWKTLYVGGNTIYLGNLQLKEASANTFAVYQADGVTEANIQVGNIDVTTIQSGTTTLGIASTNGNVFMTIGGTGNVMVVNSAGANIIGSLTASTTVSATGNIIGANYLTGGLVSATGNVTGGNFNTGGLVSATGNVTGGNLRTSGVVSATGNITGGNVSATNLTGTTVSVSGNVTGGNVLSSGIISTSGNIAGNNISGTLATASQPNITSVGTLSSLAVSGNISPGGIAMAQGNATIGNLYVSGTTTIAGNIQQVSGNSGQFFGNASTGFNALYAGLPAGFTLLPQSVVNFVSEFNSYSQINNQNLSNGDEATVDFVLTGDNGDDSTYFFDIGMTGSGYDPNVAVLNNALGNVVTPNDAYMYVTGNVDAGNPSHMVIGTVDPNSYVRFFVGGYYANATVLQLNNPDSNVTANVQGGIGVRGNATVACLSNFSGNGVGNIGSTSGYFNTAFVKATSAQYADLAEKYTADAEYESGTVVMFGGTAEVTLCVNDACRKVAGVISTNPSYIMNSGQQGEHVATVALTGRVPTRVTGRVRKGDMMVSNGDGSARAEADPRVGTVIGKALEDFDGATGTIEIVVGRI
jgi:hypothetical protein